MRVIITKNYEAMSKRAAEFVVEELHKKPKLVLGLATGGTPEGLYQELIERNKRGEIDFSQVVTFNLDEYVGLPPSHPQSYRYFMNEKLFNHININLANTHVPNGLAKDIEAFCEGYEEAIKAVGGIDLQVLGIGANGHIGFNEPGSSLASRTRIKALTQKTRQDNARFFDSLDEVPKYAITMGIGTIMDAKKCLMLASGKNKAQAIKAAIEGPITAQCPASMLQFHRYAIVVVDKEAASLLEGEGYEEES